MQLLRSLTRLAACAALALPSQAAVLNKLDIMAMQEAFDHIFTQLDSMGASFGAIQADQASVSQFVASNNKLREVIAAGTQRVKNSPSIAFLDLIHIGGPLFVMENKVSELMETLNKKKANLQQASAGKTVLDELQKDRQAVDGLINAIGQNLPLPALLSLVAGPLGNLIVNKLDSSIKEWGTS